MSEAKYCGNGNFDVYRYEVVNALIRVFGFNRYLELGVYNGESFLRIDITHKDGVDDGRDGATPNFIKYQMTTDEFFAEEREKYDVILIDALHISEQVTKDIKGSLKCLSDNGFIVLHDCIPYNYETQQVPRDPKVAGWNGDVWKAFANFNVNNPDYECFAIDSDFGIGVIRNNPNVEPVFVDNNYSWDDFLTTRNYILNIVTADQFKTWLMVQLEKQTI